jgi:hypothetical protein
VNHNRKDEEGPRIQKTRRSKDKLDKHRKAIYDLVEEEESDFDDEEWSPLPTRPQKYLQNGKAFKIRF